MACYKKSTLNITNIPEQTILTDGLVQFNNTNYKSGCSIAYTSGSDTVNLVKPGIYEVHFTATASTSDESGNVIVQLYRNGVAYNAIAETTSSSTTDIESLSFATLVVVNEVCSCCGTGVCSIPLTLVNTGIGATLTNVSFVVIKLA